MFANISFFPFHPDSFYTLQMFFPFSYLSGLSSMVKAFITGFFICRTTNILSCWFEVVHWILASLSFLFLTEILFLQDFLLWNLPFPFRMIFNFFISFLVRNNDLKYFLTWDWKICLSEIVFRKIPLSLSCVVCFVFCCYHSIIWILICQYYFAIYFKLFFFFLLLFEFSDNLHLFFVRELLFVGRVVLYRVLYTTICSFSFRVRGTGNLFFHCVPQIT